jgi:hypothetical protein
MTSDERRAIVDQHLAYGSMLRRRAYVLGKRSPARETAASCARASDRSSPTARSRE